jgi:hypothetical protein
VDEGFHYDHKQLVRRIKIEYQCPLSPIESLRQAKNHANSLNFEYVSNFHLYTSAIIRNPRLFIYQTFPNPDFLPHDS